MNRAVIVICDGLRADLITPELTPNLHRLGAGGRIFANHRSVFPSTTRTTSASIATGCLPARHGLDGNCVAINEGDGLFAISTGRVDFRDRLRAATGGTLRVPTLAERLKDSGGSIVYSNVSTGAAYFQDPDGYGTVYHRSGSYGPGLTEIAGPEHLEVSHDAAGDTAMTARFCQDALRERKPALAVLWQCEPDHTQHSVPLGSPAHREAIAGADANAAQVAETVDALNEEGEDILLIVAADHGHETVGQVIPLETLLIEAGLKDSECSSDVVVASNGFSAAIYVSEAARPRIGALTSFLATLDGIDGILTGQELADVGQRADAALAIAVTTRKTDDENEFGVRGISDAIFDPFDNTTAPGLGQHGGLGLYEQHPFLFIRGGGFQTGTASQIESSAIDLAPTILRHLGVSWEGMDGKPLPPA